MSHEAPKHWSKFRTLIVPVRGEGMRLDRLLKAWFSDWSRASLVRGIRQGQVTDKTGRVLRASTPMRSGMELNIYIPGIAPSGPPPPFPEVLYEDERLLVVNKPARMMAHPSGSTFVWSLIALARMRWSDREVDLVHRLDRDTSGALLITKDKQANHQLKAAMKAGEVHKEYTAICKGHIPWNQRLLDGRIGPAGGEIRIQMGVRDEGQSARTHVEVLARSTANCEAELTQVRCQIETGRTHQIRVHLAHAGFPLIGDRLYGVEPAVFLHALRHGADPWVMTQAGAPRHALHSSMLAFPHPDGTQRVVEAPLADDIASWWAQPHLLPLGRNSPTPSGPGD